MKKRYSFLITLIVTIVFLFYRVDAVVAMAAEENMESAAVPQPKQGEAVGADSGTEPKENTVPGGGTNEQPREDTVPGGGTNEQPREDTVPGGGTNEQPREDTVPGGGTNEQPRENTVPDDGSNEQPAAGSGPDDVKPGTEENEQPEAGLAAEESIWPDMSLQLETRQMMGSVSVLAAEQIVEPAAAAILEDTASTGSALMEWLERHKSTGGTVKLTDHVTLDENYSFYSSQANGPSIFVDTDQYTITVTGEIELMSDGHLTFSGQPDDKGIFYVAPKGSLSMQGVIVESSRGALWQEEGAGLVVSDCSISGEIHYADMPFVMYGKDFICAVVEKGQTLNDVLPMQLSCTVNRRGKLYHNEWVSVLWDQAGSEEQQEKRQRFQLHGSFLNASAAEPVSCTIAYNDYPLTFTEVEASACGCQYTFKGGFTAPEESLPFMVSAEYSFDGENWFSYEEQRAASKNAGFYIVCKLEPAGRMFCDNIYIRLQWNDNGTKYFSNVLCYAADNLEVVNDIGGSRGGGTSIINPPEEPQESIDTEASGDGIDTAASKENADGVEKRTDSPDDAGSKAVPEGGGSQGEGGNSGQTPAGSGAADTKSANVGVEVSAGAALGNVNTKPVNTDAGRAVSAKKSDAETEPFLHTDEKAEDTSMVHGASDVSKPEEETAVVLPAYGGNSVDLSQVKQQTLRENARRNHIIIFAAGTVTLLSAAGMAGVYFHFRSGTNR